MKILVLPVICESEKYGWGSPAGQMAKKQPLNLKMSE